MNRVEKIKRTITIALGFALATYLIMSGMAMLKKDDNIKNSSSHNEVSHAVESEQNNQ